MRQRILGPFGVFVWSMSLAYMIMGWCNPNAIFPRGFTCKTSKTLVLAYLNFRTFLCCSVAGRGRQGMGVGCNGNAYSTLSLPHTSKRAAHILSRAREKRGANDLGPDRNRRVSIYI